MYLTMDATRVTGQDDIGRLVRYRDVAREAGCAVELWGSAHSLERGAARMTAWWENLDSLEKVSDALQAATRELGGGERATPSPPGRVLQRLLTVIGGPTGFDPTHRYLRILEMDAVGSMQTAIDNAEELGALVMDKTAVAMTLLRNVTGLAKGLVVLSTYESLAHYEEMGHHLEDPTSWLRVRDHHFRAFDGSTLTMNLFRRFPPE